MEKILIGLMLSDKPLALKKAFASQISNAAKGQNVDFDGYTKMVDECLGSLLYPYSILNTECKEILTGVVKNWIIHNSEYSKKYIEENIITNKPFNDSVTESRTIGLQKLSFFMDLLVKPKQKLPFQNVKKMQIFFYETLDSITKLDELNMMCGFFLKYPFLLPEELSKGAMENVIAIFIKILAETPISDLIAFETKRNPTEQHIFHFLTWLNEKDDNISKIFANKIFSTLTKEGVNPSISVAKLLKYLKLEELSSYIADFIKSRFLTDDLLTLMSSRLIDWICLPGLQTSLEEWPLQVLKFLIKHEKYNILFSVVEGKIKQVFHLLFIPLFRTRALSLVTFMLISYLHSPKPFHQISPLIPNLMDQLKKEGNEGAQQVVKVMAELTYTLMYHYPGFPDIYENLLASLQGFSMPSESSMNLWLKSSLRIAPSDLPEFIVPEREAGTKVGLDNLGNTCYANSVIQVLFNMNRVKKMLLESCVSTEYTQPTTRALQQLFVLLGFSKRSSVAPRSFLHLSRPPWFQAGFQQDCSEYLKYLLDKLQTESVESKDDTNSFLSGKLRTSVECLNCGFVSTRAEIFNDIPLSFHHESNPIPSENVEQTLKGGDSSDRLKRKFDCQLSQSGDAKQTVTDDDVIGSVTSQFHDILPNNSVRYSIKDMFFRYLTPEVLKDNNRYHCENCSDLQNATKKIDIIEFPHYLVFTMKRFTYNVATHKRSKLLQVVDHPQTFTVCSSCSRCHDDSINLPTENAPGSSSESDNKSECCIRTNLKHFRLLSVIVHSGHSSDSGHYYAYTCEYSSPSGGVGVKWRLMNDSRVSNVPLDCISKLSSRFPSDTPYVCIYEKFDPDDGTADNAGQDIGVQKTLMDYLNADNASYEQELQQDAFRRRRNTFSSLYDKDKDKDDSGGSGPCGGGGADGGGGLHASGRFGF